MMMTKSFDIGFSDAFDAAGSTNGYKPGNRKVGGRSLAEYDAGFQAGMMLHHEKCRPMSEYLAWLNQPKATRGPRTQI
jgi:hypothetical protein